MRLIISIIALLSLVSCGGDSGGDGDGIDRLPSSSTSECDGDVVFHTTADEVEDVPTDDGIDEPDDVTEPEGCELSPLCRLAKSQGLKVISLEKSGNVTIVGTCGSTINVDSGNVTTNISGTLPE